MSFEVKETTPTSAVVSGVSGEESFTLTFTLIDSEYMNFKSSGSDNMAYYIWQRKILEPVMCAMEAKLCPDGSSVGRTGPNCEFAECP